MNKNVIDRLKDELSKGNLPGLEAQLKMSPVEKLFSPPNNNYKNAGVLILLYYKRNILHTVVIKRNKYPGAHSGQISFPGGQKEKHDKDLVATAIRETGEEIGICLDEIKILGTLTPLYIQVSNFNVLPVVGYLEKINDFKPDVKEVKKIIEIPVKEFFDKKNLNNLHFTRKAIKIKAPCYLINKNQIWGATAIMLCEFIELLKRTNFQQ